MGDWHELGLLAVLKEVPDIDTTLHCRSVSFFVLIFLSLCFPLPTSAANWLTALPSLEFRPSSNPCSLRIFSYWLLLYRTPTFQPFLESLATCKFRHFHPMSSKHTQAASLPSALSRIILSSTQVFLRIIEIDIPFPTTFSPK